MSGKAPNLSKAKPKWKNEKSIEDNKKDSDANPERRAVDRLYSSEETKLIYKIIPSHLCLKIGNTKKKHKHKGKKERRMKQGLEKNKNKNKNKKGEPEKLNKNNKQKCEANSSDFGTFLLKLEDPVLANFQQWLPNDSISSLLPCLHKHDEGTSNKNQGKRRRKG